MQKKVPTGCVSLDVRLEGGLSAGSIALVYGEAETGKTTLAIQSAASCARMGYKTLFLDCDGTFSTRRMTQIASEDFESLTPQIILIKPEDFEQQAYVIDRLDKYMSGKVGLVVVDTITGFYGERAQSRAKGTFALNRELNRQMACLAQIAKMRKVVCFVVSQVRSSVVWTIEEQVHPLAMRVLEFWADVSISLKPAEKPKSVKAFVRTRSRKKPDRPVLLRIEESGLRDYR